MTSYPQAPRPSDQAWRLLCLMLRSLPRPQTIGIASSMSPRLMSLADGPVPTGKIAKGGGALEGR
jgi:hypothetical protein